MHMTRFLSRSRGIRNLITRIMSVLFRFSFSSARFQRRLDRFRRVTAQFGCRPTFAVTAVTLRRHPEPIRNLSRQGVEFAVHGYIHSDYRTMRAEDQSRHLQKAMDVFRECEVPYTGFRAPFLRINGNTAALIGEAGFRYDSSTLVCWDVLDRGRYGSRPWLDYERLLRFYRPRPDAGYLTLPRLAGEIIEIPVSIPDDEAMIERLGMSSRDITEAWRAILDQTHDRGELFTIQLHPERIFACEDSLAEVLRHAGGLTPRIWTSTLGEIAGWWREKQGFALQIRGEGVNQWRVDAACSDRATLLARGLRVHGPTTEWTKGYRCIHPRSFVVECPVRPVVGMAPDTAAEARAFLRSEGYAFEVTDEAGSCSIYLDDLAQFGEEDEKPLVERLEALETPVVRFWRWPNGARSAVCVSGDIDAMTLTDFALRIVENIRRESI